MTSKSARGADKQNQSTPKEKAIPTMQYDTGLQP